MKRTARLLALLALGGCALEARPAGTQLAQGRDIDAPHIVWAKQGPLVLFDRGADDHRDLHAMPFDGGGAEIIWGTMSTWTTWLSASGYLVDGASTGLNLFTLESTTPLRHMVGAVDGLKGDDLLFHQDGREGVAAASYLVHLPDGALWELGKLTQQWFAPDGRLYYLEDTGILRWLSAADSTRRTADRLASQFVIAADQTYAVVREKPDNSSALPWQVRDRLLKLPSLSELATLPLDDRQCASCADWLGFSPDGLSFYYAENHPPAASVVYQVDVQALAANTASTRAGPSAMDLLWNARGDLGLLGERPCGDGTGCRDLYRSLVRPGPSFAPLSSPVVGATFFPSGQYLSFEDALSGGRLMAARADALNPDPSAGSVALSPAGSLLDGSAIDGDTDSVVFWARPLGGKSSINLVRSAERSNLYAAQAPTFATRRLAESADSVAIGRGYVLALVRFSPQDLTGDLVLYDLRSGHEQILASPVAAFWATPDCPSAGSPPLQALWQGAITRSTEIGQGCPEQSSLLLTFVVRGRVKSDKDGLWSLTLSL